MPINSDQFAALLLRTDALFEELIAYQQNRVRLAASRLNPRLTRDDLLNPHDFPELEHPLFQYEDGQLNGYIAAQVAWRSEILRMGRDLLEKAGWTPPSSPNPALEKNETPENADDHGAPKSQNHTACPKLPSTAPNSKPEE